MAGLVQSLNREPNQPKGITQQTMKAQKLTPGKSYNVRMYKNIKDKKPGITVRRIFKNTETRFKNIDCYVFTSKVAKQITCTVEEGNDGLMFNWHGTNAIPNEVSIPYYMIAEIKEARP